MPYRHSVMMVKFSMVSIQGLMFGYATNETEELMPLTAVLAHELNKKMSVLRESKELPWARPDSKTQVRSIISKNNTV